MQTRALHQQLKVQNAWLEETNRRLRETQTHLVQTEKMASLGQLVAGIAHEINNPLAFVINNLFLAQEGIDKLPAEANGTMSIEKAAARVQKLHTQVRNSRDGAERVKELVSKLRTFSRLDEGTFKTVDIHESIESVLLFLHHKMEGRIEIERNYGASNMLGCFAGELNQVLMNIIANAVDSIEGPGKITITTVEQNGNFVISVQDTGKGIPEEIRGKIFEPFFTTKPIGHGTGLGLAISYGIVKAHNGSIDVSSEPGCGTAFIVKIPAGLGAQV